MDSKDKKKILIGGAVLVTGAALVYYLTSRGGDKKTKEKKQKNVITGGDSTTVDSSAEPVNTSSNKETQQEESQAQVQAQQETYEITEIVEDESVAAESISTEETTDDGGMSFEDLLSFLQDMIDHSTKIVARLKLSKANMLQSGQIHPLEIDNQCRQMLHMELQKYDQTCYARRNITAVDVSTAMKKYKGRPEITQAFTKIQESGSAFDPPRLDDSEVLPVETIIEILEAMQLADECLEDSKKELDLKYRSKGDLDEATQLTVEYLEEYKQTYTANFEKASKVVLDKFNITAEKLNMHVFHYMQIQPDRTFFQKYQQITQQTQQQEMRALKAFAPYLGLKVTISGIKSKPELNGQTAEAVDYSFERKRYMCKLASGVDISLRPINLTPVQVEEKKVVAEEKVTESVASEEKAQGQAITDQKEEESEASQEAAQATATIETSAPEAAEENETEPAVADVETTPEAEAEADPSAPQGMDALD